MKYKDITAATFVDRPNRFIARVLIGGREETVHVKNTGRCRELLVPGARVFLEKSKNPNRRTAYDLVAVKKQREGDAPLLINMDSQIVNDAVQEWLLKGKLFSANAKIKREYTHGHSRFDFYIEDKGRRGFVEIKGVTLENKGKASFPDAPTKRGVKHLEHLSGCVAEGYFAMVIFVIQMKGVRSFSANAERDPEFADALKRAREAGVDIRAYDCIIEPDSIELDSPVEIVI